MNQRLLVTGAAGVVGSALSPMFRTVFPGCVLVDRQLERERQAEPVGLRVCDLGSAPAVIELVDDVTPDVVVHLAGNKDVFALESNREQATRANVDTTKHIADALKGSQTLVVFVSTDYVFEGTAGPYREDSPTRPRTEYGKSKLAAEEFLKSSDLPVAIARSASLFGYGGDFVSVVQDSLRQGREFAAFSDLVSNPTASLDFFEMLRRIIDRRLTGVFHAAGSEPVSREAFARKIAAASTLDLGLIRSERRQEKVRPADLSLDNSATYSRLEYHPRSLDTILRGEPATSRFPKAVT
jgi:dTDP-4-dehydrorhamnose reductase